MENTLPKNWVETELGNIINLMNGYAFKSTDYSNDGIPIIRMSDIENNEINIEKAVRVPEKKEYDKFIINIGDILIGMSGSIGKYGIFNLNEKVYLNQRVGNLRLISEKHTNKKLIYYFIGQFQKEIIDKAYGGAVPNISGKQIEESIFPLPPLAEQNRIVAKLDALFDQLETIKTSMAKVPLLLKDFRQQVLTQAVTGKLTEEWRKGKKLEDIELKDKQNKIELFESILNKLIPETWKLLKIETISTKITDGEHQTPKRTETGKMLLSAKNVRDGYVSYDNFDLISEEDFEKCLKRCKAEIGDVLIVSVGATIGRTAIVKEQIDFALVRSVALIKPNEYISGLFLMYVLQSKYLQDVIEKVSRGSAQSCLYINKIAGLPFPFPPLKEQQEIVSRVESLFAKADAIEKQYETLKAKLDTLPQAILHKAFKGELTQQLASDGDARELLQQIQSLRVEQSNLKKKGKKVKY